MPLMAQKLTQEQVRHVAKLSRLDLREEEVQRLAQQLSRVLDHVSKLNELEVTGVEPMAHPLDLTNVLRPDEPAPAISPEVALANAPEKDPPFFKVPKVLGEGEGA